MIRRNILCTIIFLICVQYVCAQLYYPMPTVKSEWKTERCFYLYTAGLYDEYTIFSTGEDTLMNLKMYKKLFKKVHHWPGSANDTTYTDFIGGYRENNRKVYMLCPPLTSPDTNERLIYDFSPTSVGDTIRSGRVSFNSADTMNKHVVTNIDSVIVDGKYHRRIFLTNLIGNYFQEYWIDGVGSNFGFIYASYNQITSNSYDLICLNVNDSLKFQNSSPSFGYCTSPFPPASCDSTTTFIQIDVADKPHFNIYPNPCDGEANLTIPNDNIQIQIFDTFGNMIRNYKNEQRTDCTISLESCGVYILRIISGNTISTAKLIVVK